MTAPTVSEFKSYFTREFPYAPSDSSDRKDLVTDADITRALNETALMFDEKLWADANEIKIAYLLASAHFLSVNIQDAGGLAAENAGAGLKSTGGAAVQQKSVGNVSLAYALPESITQHPFLSQFMRTGYGQRYLQLVSTRMVGGGFVVESGNDYVDFGY